jgi:predicted esterase
MKPFTVIAVALLLVSASSVKAQKKHSSLLVDTAIAQQDKKNYGVALKYYEQAFKEGYSSNYPYYYAAQCACQLGQTEKAIALYKKGFSILADYGNYEFFASDTLNKCFSQTPDWKAYLAGMKFKFDSAETIRKNYLARLNDTTLHVGRSILSDSLQIIRQTKGKSTAALIKWIRQFNQYPASHLKNAGTVYHIKVNDTLTVPFYVYIPANYNPLKKTPLYVFLHGGVSRRPAFMQSFMFYSTDQTILKKPIDRNAIILYPVARKDINWLYHQTAYETIIREISMVKSLYNIDDNRVYLAGHSDGATGTFWMATHQPLPFAAFLGFNYNPQSYFKNTLLGNLRNATPFYGISAQNDGVFNINLVTHIKNYALKIGANWKAFTLPGEHGLPYDDTAGVAFAYDSLFSQTRNPFPKQLKWETDDIKNGRYAWLEINQSDTLKEKAAWQQTLNPPDIALNGTNRVLNFNRRKTCAITAEIKGNIVRILQSRVKEITFYVSPALVDLNKPVKIYINGKLVYNAIIKPDRKVILDEFIRTKDRVLVITNKLHFQTN